MFYDKNNNDCCSISFLMVKIDLLVKHSLRFSCLGFIFKLTTFSIIS